MSSLKIKTIFLLIPWYKNFFEMKAYYLLFLVAGDYFVWLPCVYFFNIKTDPKTLFSPRPSVMICSLAAIRKQTDQRALPFSNLIVHQRFWVTPARWQHP